MIQNQQKENPSRDRKHLQPLKDLAKAFRWGAGIIVILVLVPFIASYFLDAPLRRFMENKMNEELKGYSVRLPKAHFQLIGFSMTLTGMTVSQKAYPDPPIARFPVLHADINWHALLSRRLVAEFRLEQPEIHVNLQQLSHEAASAVPLKKQGWQEALEVIYPLKIDILTIHEGSMTYIDKDPDKPLRLSRLNLDAENIRNVSLPDNVYPSTFHLETAIFQTGHGTIDGKANFLAEPYPGIKARIRLEKIPLDYFKTIIARSNLSIKNGLFSASGEVEYAPHVKKVNFEQLAIEGMAIEYIHSLRTAAAETRRAEQVGNAAREVGRSKVQLNVGQLRLTRCTVGMVNESARRPYRVFISEADLLLSNLSNQLSQGAVSKVELSGKFMGSGASRLTANLRQDKKGPDIHLKVKIENTRLTDMDDLLNAYGKVEATAGTFSFYSELNIRDGMVSGYVKPFFKQMKVGDIPEDKDKTLGQRMYETLVNGAAKLLERDPQHYVATKVDISGPLKHPHFSALQIIGRLIGNAFFNAIPPGFEKKGPGPKGK